MENRRKLAEQDYVAHVRGGGGGGGDYGKRMLDNSPQLDPWLLWTSSHSVESVPPSLGTKIKT